MQVLFGDDHDVMMVTGDLQIKISSNVDHPSLDLIQLLNHHLIACFHI